MKTILLAGKTDRQILVDDEDFELVSSYVWYAHSYGYPVRTWMRNGVNFHQYLHRLVMKTDKNVDHKNGNPLDCRKSNLRIATQRENTYNKKIAKNNMSGYKGVGLHKPTGKYRAYIGNNGKTTHLGLFENIEDAAIAYDIAAIQLFGDFARCNILV